MDYQLITMGLSAGGLQALSVLLAALPGDFSLPIAIVQHRSRDSHALATVLQEDSRLRVCEVEDKMPFDYAQVFLAPSDYHVLVEDGYFALSTEAPVTYSRPSIDVFFESAADQLGPAVIGVVMTGANRDGSVGLARIHRAGGHAIVQDPATAEVAVMPRAALETVPGACVLSLPEIADHLIALAHDGHAACARGAS